MNSICKEIFRAIHEGKWLKIEYCNKVGDITNYWIGIKSIDVGKRMLLVDGLHLGLYSLEGLYERFCNRDGLFYIDVNRYIDGKDKQ